MILDFGSGIKKDKVLRFKSFSVLEITCSIIAGLLNLY